MNHALNISFFGSSLVSAYRNGAVTYYRGLIRALHDRGHHITFYEPDAHERQQHRDIEDPDWARVIVYPPSEPDVLNAMEHACNSDVVIKCSGVGVLDDLLEEGVLELQRPGVVVAFLDVDAPATSNRIRANPADPLRRLIPEYNLILTHGGGNPIARAYTEIGAHACVPIYNALDPHTHFPVPPQPQFDADLAFLENHIPDHDARVEEFFLKPAATLPNYQFLLGGNGWQERPMPINVNYIGPIYAHQHNAFNCTPRAVLNINRVDTARYGFSPPTRVFEAAGAAACLISDHWDGIEEFLEPDREVLLADDADEVVEHVRQLTPKRARAIGEAACRHVLAEHTYAHRAVQLERILEASLREVTA
jgi:spore maturation protein CgeB